MVLYRGHFLRMNPFQTKNSRPPTVLRTRSDFFSTLLERRRSPLPQRSRARVIFVLVPVSSMKTSLWGSVPFLGCRSAFHTARAWRTSGRSHSLA